MLWPYYIAIAAAIAAALAWKLDAQGKGKSKSPSSAPPRPNDAKDAAEPSLFIKAHAMSGYALLIVRGVLLDLLEALVEGLLHGSPLSAKRMSTSTTRGAGGSRVGPNIWTGWVVFYTRRLYCRIEDCWNRPITGEASSSLELCVRKRRGYGDAAPLCMTGQTQRCLNLGSYNYLGFGGVEPLVTPSVISALREHGACACSSRAESGDTAVHRKLEAAIAAFLEKPAAVIVGMGFATNSTLIPVMVDPTGNGKGVLIVSDALNHSSIVEGVRGSGARVQPFAHNDMAHLEAILRRATLVGQPSGMPWRKIIIMVEGIYSMEGQFCRLREIVALKRKYRAYLYLDEAHSIGAVGPRGRGVTDYLGVPTSEVDVMMGTFTKSFGSVGGYIAASPELIAQLKRHSAGFLYAPAMSVPAVQQALSALEVIMGANEAEAGLGARKIAQLRRNSNLFRKGLLEMGCRVLGDIDSPVIPIMLYHPEKICNFSRACLRRGLAVVVVGYPATPLLLSRARFCIAASHTEEELVHALAMIKEAAREVGIFYDRGVTDAMSDDAARRRQHELLTAPMDAVAVTEWVPEPLAQPLELAKVLAPDARVPSALPSAMSEEVAQAVETVAGVAEAAVDAAPLLRAQMSGKAAAVAAETLELASCEASEEAVAAALDLRRTDFCRLAAAALPREAAERALERYGCGTCGPRGFYGTLDVHLELEDKLAAFLGTEQAIVYSFGIATISSVVPAFVRKGDLLFVDDGVHFTTAVGVRLARGEVRSFAHNDVGALEAALAAQRSEEEMRNTPPAKRPRRFVLVEGLFANSGDVAPLVELLRLRDVYGFYLIVDDTLGFAALGATGRGSAEACGVPPSTIDVLVGSLEHSLGSVGGFCAGSKDIVSHQRLSGSGYCFSASLPAYATVAAMEALAVLQAEPDRLARLSTAAVALHEALAAALAETAHVELLGLAASPIAHVRFAPSARNRLSHRRQEVLLRSAAASVRLTTGAAVQPLVHSGLAHVQQPHAPSIRLTAHSDTELAALPAVAAALAQAVARELHAEQPTLAACAEWRGMARPLSSRDLSTDLERSPSSGMLTDEPGALGRLAEMDKKKSAEPLTKDDVRLKAAVQSAVVTLPLIHMLELARSSIRTYIQRRQMETCLPMLHRFRSSRSPAVQALCELGTFLGSEAFYFVVIPMLSWSASSRASVPMFVTFFALSLYVGNWLKNLFALNRPDGAVDASIDFGWPSLYAVNAVGVPFFAMRYWYGGIGTGTPYSASFPFTTALSYTLAFLWVVLVCGARLYSGATTPADVQGGMLVGGVLVRAWLPFSDVINEWILSRDSRLLGLPQWAALLLISAALLLIHPFSPQEPRSWNALSYSSKAVVFGATFILGSNYCAHHGCTNDHVALDTAPPSLAVFSKLLLRNTIGFAALGASYAAAAAAAKHFSKLSKPYTTHIPCAPIMAKRAFCYATIGATISAGAPLLFGVLGI